MTEHDDLLRDFAKITNLLVANYGAEGQRGNILT
jgi:hypothetical protein